MHSRPHSQQALQLCAELVIQHCAHVITKLSDCSLHIDHALCTHTLHMLRMHVESAGVSGSDKPRRSTRISWRDGLSPRTRRVAIWYARLSHFGETEQPICISKAFQNSCSFAHSGLNKTSSATSFIFQLEQIHTNWVLSLYKLPLWCLCQRCLPDSTISIVFSYSRSVMEEVLRSFV